MAGTDPGRCRCGSGRIYSRYTHAHPYPRSPSIDHYAAASLTPHPCCLTQPTVALCSWISVSDRSSNQCFHSYFMISLYILVQKASNCPIHAFTAGSPLYCACHIPSSLWLIIKSMLPQLSHDHIILVPSCQEKYKSLIFKRTMVSPRHLLPWDRKSIPGLMGPLEARQIFKINYLAM